MEERKFFTNYLKLKMVEYRFSSATVENKISIQNLVPKVQFNLLLSEKEIADRSKVVLPFEHQGTGETIRTYDGPTVLFKQWDGLWVTAIYCIYLCSNRFTE